MSMKSRPLPKPSFSFLTWQAAGSAKEDSFVDQWLIPLTQVTATMALAADLKPPEDESNPWPPKLADHAFGFLCRSLTGPEVGKGGKE